MTDDQASSAGPSGAAHRTAVHEDRPVTILDRLRDRSVVVVAAHPDDEVIGTGAQFVRLRHVSFIHVTDGAPRDMRDADAAGFQTRDGYRQARRSGLLAALAVAGISAAQTFETGRRIRRAAGRGGGC